MTFCWLNGLQTTYKLFRGTLYKFAPHFQTEFRGMLGPPLFYWEEIVSEISTSGDSLARMCWELLIPTESFHQWQTVAQATSGFKLAGFVQLRELAPQYATFTNLQVEIFASINGPHGWSGCIRWYQCGILQARLGGRTPVLPTDGSVFVSLVNTLGGSMVS
jgi:hypothetical protein